MKMAEILAKVFFFFSGGGGWGVVNEPRHGQGQNQKQKEQGQYPVPLTERFYFSLPSRGYFSSSSVRKTLDISSHLIKPLRLEDKIFTTQFSVLYGHI